jgi:hypothetical protein
MPSPMSFLRELAELELDPNRAYTADDIGGERTRRREQNEEWVLIARGKSKIKPDGEVVTTSEDVPNGEG